MAKHCYALVNADGGIQRVTEPLEVAPGNIDGYVWQQVFDDAPGVPAHNAHLFERHSPRFEMDGHRVVRRFSIRRKANG
jgi:hypothetical protein